MRCSSSADVLGASKKEQTPAIVDPAVNLQYIDKEVNPPQVKMISSKKQMKAQTKAAVKKTKKRRLEVHTTNPQQPSENSIGIQKLEEEDDDTIEVVEETKQEPPQQKTAPRRIL